MPRSLTDVVVIGAGVSGLTTAIRLAEAGRRVSVWTADEPLATTSMAAGAMWGPYLVEPLDRVQAWSAETLHELRHLADEPGTGVRLVAGVEASREPVKPPDWGSQLDQFRMCAPVELPNGFATGWRFVAPLVDMPVYLTYLQRRLRAAGAEICLRRIGSLAEAASAAPVVVNCAGIGAHDLVPDPELFPVRGHLVVVENPGITEFFSEDTGSSPDLLHYAPHGNTVVVGGTAEPRQWTREPDPSIATAIITRCATVEPRLRHARVIGHRVGLRPTRPRVRVEADRVGHAVVVHNYGHGGAGVTLSWGCASEVTTLAVA
ncbi:FAD-dependent oxidoreductase [Virgisporangium aurantiacum]|uniref:D-amino-acid oxidase n=1 Tax=Virgisporangium aurantiacum TaxID=175570 RepID=A0A8J4DZX6_9ACTN|nr:FAD-dependent oxidoreductase [Virgisporangium aurantiacum]GIJ56156.1 amino acid oxidase [Virgisporangium aurantiacum]